MLYIKYHDLFYNWDIVPFEPLHPFCPPHPLLWQLITMPRVTCSRAGGPTKHWFHSDVEGRGQALRGPLQLGIWIWIPSLWTRKALDC